MRKIGAPDIVVLGMGDDAHIASLFPPVSPEAFGPALTLHTETERFAVKDRITVTFPVLLAAKKRIFLITGKEKQALLKKMQTVNEDVSLYPAQYLFDERTIWVVGP
jgi:6-phosphogluconolactonase/glucosamine-6-phosphate isomerase/deaminase